MSGPERNTRGPRRRTDPFGSEDWLAQLIRLQDALTLCPTDITSRCELAALLEALGQPEEAFVNWKAVLSTDPNSLTAREGMARCHRKVGWPLQSSL